MAFAVFAEREAQITQNLLLSGLFPDEILEETEEPIVPISEQNTALVPVETEQPVGTLIVPQTNNIQIVTNSTTFSVYTDGTNTWVYDSMAEFRDANRRLYTSTSTTSGTNYNIWTPEMETAPTNTIIRTTATNGIYINTTGTIYTNAISTAWVNGNVIGEWKKPEPSPVKKFVKNSIKRALKLLDNYGMEQDTKIFLKGNEVEVSHPDSLFKFVITKKDYHNVISLTERPYHSVPFRLELFTKSGIHIANLCVYAKDTPMLDQLFMVAMYVKTGNEEDLLRKANYSCITQDKELKEIIVSEVEYLGPKLLPNQKGHGGGTYINADIQGNVLIANGSLTHA